MTGTRPRLPAALAAVLVLVVAVALGAVWVLTPSAGTRTVASSAPAGPAGTGPGGSAGLAPAGGGPLLGPSRPVALDIPAIGVRSSLLTLGLAPDGTVETPPLESPDAGWYEHSPTPGELGPAVVLGHVDSARSGPGVFIDLDELRPGDAVTVDRSDGTTAAFRVDRVEQHPKSAFPTAAVYGDVDHAGLRLVTCGGTFDTAARSYRDNIIVFASAVPLEEAR